MFGKTSHKDQERMGFVSKQLAAEVAEVSGYLHSRARQAVYRLDMLSGGEKAMPGKTTFEKREKLRKLQAEIDEEIRDVAHRIEQEKAHQADEDARRKAAEHVKPDDAAGPPEEADRKTAG